MQEKQNRTWFDIDRAGLAKILKRKGIEFAVFELIQNSWDEAGVTTVNVTLRPSKDHPKTHSVLMVEDDAPEGFKDLRHAYTLFAESEKVGNPEQRGRFNLGEKLVLSLCDWAMIQTTKGTVTFDGAGRAETSRKRPAGSSVEMHVKIGAAERERIDAAMTKLLPQPGIETYFNGALLAEKLLEKEFTATLYTEIDSRPLNRKTVVRCYQVAEGETPMIYEMGIPVVEHHGCAFHCDVRQKIPVTLDRENIVTTSGFLKGLQTALYNETHQDLDSEDVNHEWVQTAIESGHATPEAVTDYMGKRFGELRASYDPSDPEANSRAQAAGYTIVHGSMLSKTAWESVREAKAITPAGQIFPTHSDNFVAFEQADETDGMKAVRDYSKALARLLLGTEIRVEFGEQDSREAACWGACRLQFNVRNLGKQWFDLKHNRIEIDDLIVHEFGHHYEANHLSDSYNNALTRLAAKAMQLGRAGRLPE